jgi:hypothetical protein
LKKYLKASTRALAVAALMGGAASAPAKAEGWTNVANLQSQGVGQTSELVDLYVRDLARAHCPAASARASEDAVADAIFTAELRSGLEAPELERLHSKAEAMVSDPSFCSRASSLPALPPKAG